MHNGDLSCISLVSESELREKDLVAWLMAYWNSQNVAQLTLDNQAWIDKLSTMSLPKLSTLSVQFQQKVLDVVDIYARGPATILLGV